MDEYTTNMYGEKVILIDFDGVIHDNRGPWEGYEVINGPPMPGAFDWIDARLKDGYKVYLWSARCNYAKAVTALRAWFDRYGATDLYEKMTPLPGKPPVALVLDDHAVRFDGGIFPSKQELTDLEKSWARKQ